MKALFASALLLLTFPLGAQTPATAAAPAKPGVLTAADVQQLMPPAVFFAGQSATVQLRNSGGIRFGDNKLALAGLVDTGGYSSSVRDKYQFYLITEVPLDAGGKRIAPGAYGCGFVGGRFLVMDIGGGDLLQTATATDSAMKRPRPFQIMAGTEEGEFRIFSGREFVTLRRVK